MLAGYWNDGADSVVTTFRLGWTNAAASLLVALLVPFIGAIADGAAARKKLLAVFAGLGIAMTAALFFVAAGQWGFAALLFVCAYIGFAVSNSLYDSLMLTVAEESVFDRVSAYGYALGYLGGAILFTFNVVLVSFYESFGLVSADAAIRWSFLSVAVWWAFFSLPLLLWVREPGGAGVSSQPIRNGMRRLLATAREVRGHRTLLLFLCAYWLYIDGVYTIIKMAVDFGLSQGLSMSDLITAILVTNFVGFPAALLFGVLGARIGPKRGVVVALTIYLVVTLAAPFIDSAAEFYVLAVTIGLVQGGVQSLSRSLYARLIPAGKSAEFFGFYNMIGKFAAILGPALTGVITLLTGSQRWGIASIAVLFVGGLLLLVRVKPKHR
jgi:UMF1 family MFS transporter